MPTLFQIVGEIGALHDLLTETGGELPNAEAEAAIDQWLAETNLALDTKVNSICWLIREFEGRADVREQAAKALLAIAATDANEAKRLKARLKLFLEMCGLEKFQTEHFKLNIQANGGKEPLVYPEGWDRDPASAPERYHKTVIALDKEMLRRDAERTEAEAARLSDSFAHGRMTAEQYNDAMRVFDENADVRLGERGKQLRIK
ncbi:MAG TPA: siphovirus Gp157 family protein [Blastocatellia bacterium]|nr:siphovirus Gp157 family protein [Blastocatellia bacterium]